MIFYALFSLYQLSRLPPHGALSKTQKSRPIQHELCLRSFQRSASHDITEIFTKTFFGPTRLDRWRWKLFSQQVESFGCVLQMWPVVYHGDVLAAAIFHRFFPSRLFPRGHLYAVWSHLPPTLIAQKEKQGEIWRCKEKYFDIWKSRRRKGWKCCEIHIYWASNYDWVWKGFLRQDELGKLRKYTIIQIGPTLWQKNKFSISGREPKYCHYLGTNLNSCFFEEVEWENV